MEIRIANHLDTPAILQLHLDAFSDDSPQIVSQLVEDLLTDDSSLPRLGLVAEVDGQVVGFILFSNLSLHNSEDTVARILAPLAVSPNCQRRGIGSALVRHGLKQVKNEGVDIVLVYGAPAFYSRFGFTSSHKIVAPFPLKHPAAWTACQLTAGQLTSVSARAIPPDPLLNATLW